MLKIETVPAGPKFTALRQQLGPTIHLSGGWTVLQPMDARDQGVDAFVPTEMEEAYVAIWELHRAGAVEEARALWEQLLPILAFSNQSIDVTRVPHFWDGFGCGSSGVTVWDSVRVVDPT